jgi:hypothetical protein
MLLQSAQQHHRAGDRQREAEHQAAADGPAPVVGEPHAKRRGDRDLQHRAGQRHLAHGPQVVERKVQADAEHHQHHADFSQLAGQRGIRHKARRGRADDNARSEITHQRRQLQARCKITEQEASSQCGGDGGNQADIVGHACGAP